MASPGELVKQISQATGINEATVSSTHRYLRDAGLITKGGRGNSSAKMSSMDAANLLIGLLGATSINDSPEIVERYGNLKIAGHITICKLKNFSIEKDADTLSKCVQSLFERLRSDDVARSISTTIGRDIKTEDLDYQTADISISVYRPEPKASVIVRAFAKDRDEFRVVDILNIEYGRTFRKKETGGLKINPAIMRSEVSVGLKEQRWIDIDVVKSIAKIL